MSKPKHKTFLQRTTEEIRQWKLLARDASEGTEQKVDERQMGAITIVGSGIMCVGHFTLEALGYIKTCDKVFFCVADPVTELYIKDIRPDAMDLYVLYDDDKERYITYVQMSEVMLSEARKGLHVVGIFYGHPGVFVLPSHRALQIAEREGIKTRMLAAPSAEDCLFADLGIDPSFPGCQSFEATDLLLRNRQICTDLHVIIWQVGCVGNTGFRFKGYINDKLYVLIEHLQNIYGFDYTLTHYIGPQYPICDAIKEKIRLSDFSLPEVRKKVTGISTFYIPPNEVKDIDATMAETLGLKIRISKQKPTMASRHIGAYNTRERSAVADLKDWTLPQNYMFSVPSEMSTYLTKRSTNPNANFQESNMSIVQRKAIESKHPGRIRMLLKSKNEDAATIVAMKIFTDGNFAATYLAIMKAIDDKTTTFQIVDTWLEKNGFHTTAEEVQTAMDTLMKSSLLPWSNSYKTSLGKTLYIDAISNPSSPLILWGSEVVKLAKMVNGTLTWSSNDGNISNGEMSFRRKLNIAHQMDPDKIDGKDALLIIVDGYIWDNDKPGKPNVHLELSPVSTIGLSTFKGQYALTIDGKTTHNLVVNVTPKETAILFDGRKVENYEFSSCTLNWKSPENKENAILYMVENLEKEDIFVFKVVGKIWSGNKPPTGNNTKGLLNKTTLTAWLGNYKTSKTDDRSNYSYGPEIKVEESGIYVSGSEVEYQLSSENKVEWTTEENINFQIQFYQQQKTEPKRFLGYIWKEDKKPQKSNIFGTEDKNGLAPWSAYYKTDKNDSGGKYAPYLEFIIFGTADGVLNNLSIGGKNVQGLLFNNPVLSWNHPGNDIDGEVTFYMKQNSRVRRFTGKVWKPTEYKPKDANITGIIDHDYLLSWSGLYYTSVKHGDKFKQGGPTLQIEGATTQNKSVVVLDGHQINDWSFNNPTMSWTSSDNTYSAEIRFYFPVNEELQKNPNDAVPHFAGKLWKKGTISQQRITGLETKNLPISDHHIHRPT